MTNRFDTAVVGTVGLANFGSQSCPDGAVISEITGNATACGITKICAKCSDGTALKCIDGNPASIPAQCGGLSGYIYQGPFSSIVTRAANRLYQLFNSGAPDSGRPASQSCGSKYIVGIKGTYTPNSYVNSLGWVCGEKASEYCQNNLESAMCKNVDKDTLNKACANNMTATCRNRKDELDESLVESYCKAHPEDEMCACYKLAPDYIPAEVRGLVPCWNQTCATKGYIPQNMRKPCPTVTICRQELPVTGDSNVLADAVVVQNCGTTTTTPPPDNNNTPPGSTNTGDTSTDNTNTNNTNTDSNSLSDSLKKLLESNNIRYLILFVLIIAIVIGGIKYKESDNQTSKSSSAGASSISLSNMPGQTQS